MIEMIGKRESEKSMPAARLDEDKIREFYNTEQY